METILKKTSNFLKKAILKNYPKFNNIKLALGINLGELKTVPRPEFDHYNVSTKTYGRKWFLIKKQKVLFKTYDDYLSEIKNIRIANELICCELAKQLNINCAKYELAHINNSYGLITYNFIQPKQQILSFSDFFKLEISRAPKDDNLLKNLDDRCYLKRSLRNLALCIDMYNKCGYKINKQAVIFDIYKILVFDLLTMQCDRNPTNIDFLINYKKKTITLAPMFDNELSFCVQTFEDFINQKEDINIKASDFFKKYFKQTVNISILNDYKKMSAYEKNLNEVVALAKANPILSEFLKQSLENINIEEAIKIVKQKGVEISPEYKQYITEIIDYSQKLLNNELKKFIIPNKELFEIK